jgi:superfamily II DNA or RNA helicase
VSSLRKRIGRDIAPLPSPRIVSTRKFKGKEPSLLGLPDVFGDGDLEPSPPIVAPDVIEPLTQDIEPDHFHDVDLPMAEAPMAYASSAHVELTTSLTRDLLNPTGQGEVSAEILSELLELSYPAKSLHGIPVEVAIFVDIVDPFAPDGQLVLMPPEIVSDLAILLPFVRVMGMNYRDRIWQDITPVYDQIAIGDIQKKRKRRKGGRVNASDAHLEDRVGSLETLEEPVRNFWEDAWLLLQPSAALPDIESLELPNPLYPFQPAGVKFLMENEGALLADEMGTGKTVMTTVALRILSHPPKSKVKKALILCPVSVLREWVHHLHEWAPELWLTLVRGTRSERVSKWQMSSHVFLTTYSTFRNDLKRSVLPSDGVATFDAVILDEAQYIKNPDSGRSKAVKKLKASYRWALSGTPVENKLEDLASIFEFLHPGYLDPDNLEPAWVKERIAPYFLRRRKRDVLPDLPPKQRQEFWLSLNAEQRRAYRRVESAIRDEFDALGSYVSRIHIFSAMTQFKQICNFAPGRYTSPKVRLLKEQVEEIIENEQKVLVFTQFIDEGLLKLQQALSPYGLAIIRGGQSDRERAAQVARFKRTPARDVPILLASVRAAGVGLNLKEATYVIHFDHWWNPAVMWQAEDRAHRADQTHGVNVYSYWIEDTIEERIYDKLAEKRLLFDSVVGDLATDEIAHQISTEEWIDIVLDRDNGQPSKDEVSRSGRGAVASSRASMQQMSVHAIVDSLLDLTPSAFEHLTGELMRRLGYPYVEVTGQTADGGVDVIASHRTEAGLERVAVQCKRYKSVVGVEVARALRGVIASDPTISRGYLVTSGRLTAECSRFCATDGIIETISGLEMARYVKQYNLPLDDF